MPNAKDKKKVLGDVGQVDPNKPVSSSNPPPSRGTRVAEHATDFDFPAEGQTKAGQTMEQDATETQRLAEKPQAKVKAGRNS